MSLRSLSKHRTEASYANAWKHPSASSSAVKHTQYIINRFHRAVRRAQQEVIQQSINEVKPSPVPAVGGVYHCNVFGYSDISGLPQRVIDRVTFHRNNPKHLCFV